MCEKQMTTNGNKRNEQTNEQNKKS